MANELSLLERLAHWVESQGGCVKSTHFSYSDGEATISAVIDLDRTSINDVVGADELRKLMDRAEAALRLDHKVLPSTLEVVAKNMARSLIKLRRLAHRRGPDYFFDLFALIDRERENAVQEGSETT